MDQQTELIYSFNEDLRIRFILKLRGYYPTIEYRTETKTIPLLISENELEIILRDIKDIWNIDYPFDTLCNVISGYLVTVLRYKCHR
jgi:hypothetical protein